MRLILLSTCLFAFISIDCLIQAVSLENISSITNNKQKQRQQQQQQHQVDHQIIKPSKFIILTTGDQIKLYPFKETSTNDRDQILASNYYLIQPREFLNESSQETRARLGNNSLSDWIISKSADRSNQALNGDQRRDGSSVSTRSPTKSIIPANQGTNDEDFLSGDWRKPVISDVDYFFDSRLCNDVHSNASHLDCLVVVWLDVRNNFVRVGSVKLAKSFANYNDAKSASPTPTSNKNNVLWLRELPPIVLLRDQSDKDLKVHGMVVDKLRGRVHVALNDGSTNKVVSIRLRSSILEVDEIDAKQFDVDCLTQQVNYDISQLSFQNFNIDPQTGDWLFYLDKRAGGRIFSVNVYANKSARGLSEIYARRTIETIVRDLDGPDRDVANNSSNKRTPLSSLGMTMDPLRRRLYWLTSANELYECNYAGQEVNLIGKLSLKPAIRSIQSMQVLDDTIYMSDSIKKSLIAYKIGRNGGKREDRDLSPTHQVLLVEMPTIYGFRLMKLVDFQSYDLVVPNGHLHSDERQMFSRYQALMTEISADQGLLSKFTSSFANLLHKSGDEYDELLDRFKTQGCASDWSRQYLVDDSRFGVNEQTRRPIDEPDRIYCSISILLLWFSILFLVIFTILKARVESPKATDKKPIMNNWQA